MNTRRLQTIMTGLLAVLLLASTLAACDEIGSGELSESTEEIINSDEIYNNGISELYGLTGIFSELNYKGLITNTSNSNYNYIMNSYKKLEKRVEKDNLTVSDVTIEDKRVACIGQVINGEQGNVVINVNSENWNHKIVTTADDFFMISKDTKTEVSYLTGFFNGQFYNDLGMNGEESVELVIQSLNKSDGYDKLVQRLKGEFWGIILRESIDEKSYYYSGSVGMGYVISFKNGIDAQLTDLDLYDKEGKFIFKMPVQTNVEIMEIIDWVMKAQNNPNAIPPHYREDYTEPEEPRVEETTVASTEAEIEPPAA